MMWGVGAGQLARTSRRRQHAWRGGEATGLGDVGSLLEKGGLDGAVKHRLHTHPRSSDVGETRSAILGTLVVRDGLSARRRSRAAWLREMEGLRHTTPLLVQCLIDRERKISGIGSRRGDGTERGIKRIIRKGRDTDQTGGRREPISPSHG